MLMVLLLQAAVPTLAEVEPMTPAKAGEVVLRGRAHEPIEAVETRPDDPSPFPDILERDLIERPVRAETGCVRRRRRAEFAMPPMGSAGAAALQSVHAATEVALVATSTCPTADYVRLQPYLDAPTALDVLKLVERIRTGRQGATFACTDETDDAEFCRSRRSILRELATRRAWILSRDGSGFAASLDGPTPGIVTLQFDPRTPDRVVVTKAYPAPF